MTTQTKLPQSIFPDLPRERPAVDKEGNFTAYWSLAFSSLFQALQRNLKNEGFLIPSLSKTDINTILAIYTPYIGQPLPTNPVLPDISGQMVFDSTNRVPKMFVITYNTTTPPTVATVAWKTFTLT